MWHSYKVIIDNVWGAGEGKLDMDGKGRWGRIVELVSTYERCITLSSLGGGGRWWGWGWSVEREITNSYQQINKRSFSILISSVVGGKRIIITSSLQKSAQNAAIACGAKGVWV